MNDTTQPSDRRFMNMDERGVPEGVQCCVLSGQAVIYGRRH